MNEFTGKPGLRRTFGRTQRCYSTKRVGFYPRLARRFLFLCLFVLLGSDCLSAYCAPPPIQAKSAILMDATTGQVLYEKNSRIRSAPASTTKIVTAILAIESGRLEEVVTVSPQAAATAGSSMHLYTGQRLALQELVTGLLLRSGNDAATAIAEHLAGSTENFALLMNKQAERVGAFNSQFKNPHGLSASGHYTTAFDLAWLTRYALTNPLFAEIVSTKETSIEWFDRKGKEHEQNLRNTNKLLWMLEDADGVKTGTTSEAGPCLISSATRDGQKLIAVVLHDHARWYDSLQLLKHGFEHFQLIEYAASGDTLAILPVDSGMEVQLDAVLTDAAHLVIAKEDQARLTVEIDLPEKIKAPVYQGQKIGELIFFIGDKAVKTVSIQAAQTVEERTAVRTFLQHLLATFRYLSGWGLL